MHKNAPCCAKSLQGCRSPGQSCVITRIKHVLLRQGADTGGALAELEKAVDEVEEQTGTALDASNEEGWRMIGIKAKVGAGVTGTLPSWAGGAQWTVWQHTAALASHLLFWPDRLIRLSNRAAQRIAQLRMWACLACFHTLIRWYCWGR